MRTARPDEAGEISALALRSKGHWGYSAAFLEACRDELTVTPEECAAGSVTVADMDGTIAGFFSVSGTVPTGVLDALFVDPQWIGKGVGRALLLRALRIVRADGFRSLELDADPGAEGFYAKHGAVTIGTAPSGSIPGRMLPHMRFDLGGE
ncbi:GNAT family N-acetyltransferase [Microbacterium gorillae]|uniref:GNAT family N-acetyltransferase n=1 Tax=Microbacterium gorillae TaxID=1231063 RepID=UPI0005917F9F|nr:GNAT family N-acetyltransferase [Microbacterium gorillae]